MRWFWLFILTLILLTVGLYVMRVNQSPVTAPARIVPNQRSDSSKSTNEIKSNEISTTDEVEPKQKPEPSVEVKQSGIEQEVGLPGIEEVAESDFVQSPKTNVDEADSVVASKTEPVENDAPSNPVTINEDQEDETNNELELVSTPEVAQNESNSVVEQIEEVVPVQVPKEEVVVERVPDFEQLADGSIKIAQSGKLIEGKGTSQSPFIVDWVTLRSIERVFNPKEKMTDLPDWIQFLDGKQVKIIGNTLVPVIATTTRELLVMQNPWDGCCIGIPPSPYDAIEVTLNHDVDFGSSAVGYGTVEGVFILDPYVVEGWVLGLYIIEDASYRSGEGIAFPDF